MGERPRPPVADPYRKARFREEAREIVAKDRHNRGRGLTVDTAGAIARALERAYKQGFLAAQGTAQPAPPPIADDGPLDWGLIPPRPRGAFWSCCLFMLGRRGDTPRGGHLVPELTDRGTDGWRLVVPGFSGRDVFSAKTITPLARLGLLERDEAAQHRLVLSDRGRLTWAAFLAQGGQYPDDLPPP